MTRGNKTGDITQKEAQDLLFKIAQMKNLKQNTKIGIARYNKKLQMLTAQEILDRCGDEK